MRAGPGRNMFRPAGRHMCRPERNKGRSRGGGEPTVVATKAIVSYDGTANDRDALALGELLSRAGVELVLTYVRHASRDGAHEADALLRGGASWLGNPDVARRVVLSGSTPEGLKWLSAREDAALVIFGSDYRTPAGRV